MKKVLKVAALTAALMMISSSAFAEESRHVSKNSCPPSEPVKRCPKPKPVKRCKPKPPKCPCPALPAKPPMAPSYSAPARVTTRCEWDTAVWASFIYWQPRMEMFTVGALRSFDLDDNVLSESAINMDFGWKPGFKVGASTKVNRDDWIAFAQYTRIYGGNRVSEELTADEIQDLELTKQIKVIPNGFFDDDTETVVSLKTRWKLSGNWMDFGFQRAYYSGKELTFTPFFGPKVAWITHRVHGQLYEFGNQELLTYNQYNRVKSWKVGPRVGFLGSWHLGEGVRFTGDAAFSILYSRYKTRVRNSHDPFETQNPDSWPVSNKDKQSQLVPWAEMSWGLAWGSYFNQDRWHMDLSAAYELHAIWDETMFNQVAFSFLGGNLKSSDLYFHGLTLNAKFDF